MTINLNEMVSLLIKEDPRRVYMDFINKSEEFRGFIERNKDKNTEEMIKCYNLNKVIRETMSHV